MSDNRDERSISFDRIAALYDRFCPSYPDAVFEDAIAFSSMATSRSIKFSAAIAIQIY
jgi:hypothetical protein